MNLELHAEEPVSGQDLRERVVTDELFRDPDLAEGWNAFLNQAGLGAWCLDVPTGVIRYSEGWANSLGYTPEEIEEMEDPWSRLVHPEDRARVIALHLENLESGRGVYECEQRLLHRSGEYRWMLARCRVETDRRGRPIRSLGCQIDITDLKNRLFQFTQIGTMRTGYVQQAPVHIAVFDRQRKDFVYWSRQEDSEGLWRMIPHRHEGEAYLFLLNGAPGEILTIGEEGMKEQIELFEVDCDEDEDLIGLVVRALPEEAHALAEARKAVGALHGRLRALRNENRSLESLASSLQDTSTQLERLSQIDSLTGLLNRRAFDDRLEDFLERGRQCSVLLLDIDHFKAINDTHGHQMGDSVLREAARTLRSFQGPGHHIARIGGEEFGWIIPDSPLSKAVEAAEEARRAFEEEKWSTGRLTISIGAAQSRGGEQASSLFARADTALYAAKRGGRNRVKAEESHDKNRRAA